MKKLKRGFYAIFEGDDLTGKTTTMQMVAAKLQEILQKVVEDLVIHQTHNPGSTPLGQHLRQLIRHPESISPLITIDHLSRQVLYLADATSFLKTVLEPALAMHEIVLADRSSISGLVYSCADGVPFDEIHRLHNTVMFPRADRLYVLTCPPEVAAARLEPDREQDRYDKLGLNFHRTISGIYDTLATGPVERTMLVSRYVALENIIYVDNSMSQQAAVDFIVKDFLAVLSERERLSI